MDELETQRREIEDARRNEANDRIEEAVTLLKAAAEGYRQNLEFTASGKIFGAITILNDLIN